MYAGVRVYAHMMYVYMCITIQKYKYVCECTYSYVVTSTNTIQYFDGSTFSMWSEKCFADQFIHYSFVLLT